MLHIVAFIWFSVLAASHFPDHSLSFISANIYIFFNVSFCEDFFLFINNLLNNSNTEDDPCTASETSLSCGQKVP